MPLWLPLLQPKLRMIPIRLVNCTSEPCTVYALKQITLAELVGDVVGSVGELEQDISKGSPLTKEKEEILWPLVENADTDLRLEQREMFYQLLASYADVIAESPTDLGRTDLLQHSIDTGSVTPIRQPVRRLPPQRRNEVRNLLQNMLHNGIVEPSRSPWASPIVLIQKKDGSTRFCVDYRKLNGVTKKTPTRCHGSTPRWILWPALNGSAHSIYSAVTGRSRSTGTTGKRLHSVQPKDCTSSE